MTKIDDARLSVPKIRIRQLLKNRTTREVFKICTPNKY